MKLSEVEDYVFARVEEEDDFELMEEDEHVLDVADDGYIVLSSWHAYIPGINISVKSGTYYQQYEDGEFVADFDVSVFFVGNMESYDYLYFEQGGFNVSLYNFMWQIESELKDSDPDILFYRKAIVVDVADREQDAVAARVA